MNSEKIDVKTRPRHKLGVLDPYAEVILMRYRQGQAMKEILSWLEDPPRNVVISRQGVHKWVKTRIRTIAKRAVELGGTERVESPNTANETQISTQLKPILSPPSALIDQSQRIANEEKDLYSPWETGRPPKVDFSEEIRQVREGPDPNNPFDLRRKPKTN